MDKRRYGYKKAVLTFLCPLCGVERAFVHNYKLRPINFLQISLLTLAFTGVFYQTMKWKGLFSFFLIWMIFETGARLLRRKEIPCPHCGFDASWYKRDVKVARRLVQEFWQSRGPDPAGSANPAQGLEPKQDASSQEFPQDAVN